MRMFTISIATLVYIFAISIATTSGTYPYVVNSKLEVGCYGNWNPIKNQQNNKVLRVSFLFLSITIKYIENN